MHVIIKIKLGNDAMLTGDDVSQALLHVGATFERNWGPDEIAQRCGGSVMDSNGNTVGKWEVA